MRFYQRAAEAGDFRWDSAAAIWAVEFVEGVVRLRSCSGKYLTAKDKEFLPGVTGRKVVQSVQPIANGAFVLTIDTDFDG